VRNGQVESHAGFGAPCRAARAGSAGGAAVWNPARPNARL